MTLTFGSLFSGIGGFDIGLERAGMQCVWQVEISAYCRGILARRWPDVRRHGDIRTFPPTNPEEWICDVIAGGFPCQDASKANPTGAGLWGGARTGLWFEYARIIRLLRPRYAVMENVPALLVRGFGRVLGELAAIGYDAEWSVLSACALGAPHTRERLFVVAYPHSERCQKLNLAAIPEEPGWPGGTSPANGNHWRTQPCPEFVVDGVPSRVAGVRAAGNAVVPQIAEMIARAIIRHAE